MKGRTSKDPLLPTPHAGRDLSIRQSSRSLRRGAHAVTPCFLLLGLLSPLVLGSATLSPEDTTGRGDGDRGRALFTKNCVLCHGVNGEGRPHVQPRPGDLRDPDRTPRRSDDDLYRVIRDGGPALGLSSTMFGWADVLDDQEILDLVAFLRRLAEQDPEQ